MRLASIEGGGLNVIGDREEVFHKRDVQKVTAYMG
jgi:hypothetical protein